MGSNRKLLCRKEAIQLDAGRLLKSYQMNESKTNVMITTYKEGTGQQC